MHQNQQKHSSEHFLLQLAILVDLLCLVDLTCQPQLLFVYVSLANHCQPWLIHLGYYCHQNRTMSSNETRTVAVGCTLRQIGDPQHMWRVLHSSWRPMKGLGPATKPMLEESSTAAQEQQHQQQSAPESAPAPWFRCNVRRSQTKTVWWYAVYLWDVTSWLCHWFCESFAAYE